MLPQTLHRQLMPSGGRYGASTLTSAFRLSHTGYGRCLHIAPCASWEVWHVLALSPAGFLPLLLEICTFCTSSYHKDRCLCLQSVASHAAHNWICCRCCTCSLRHPQAQRSQRRRPQQSVILCGTGDGLQKGDDGAARCECSYSILFRQQGCCSSIPGLTYVGVLAAPVPPTVADTKAKFYKTFQTPIPSIYNNVIQELLVQQHLMRYNRKYKYDQVQSQTAGSRLHLTSQTSSDRCRCRCLRSALSACLTRSWTASHPTWQMPRPR